MALTTKQKGALIIHSFATGAAAWSAATAFIPVAGPLLADTAGLTAITIAMTYSLASLFGKKLEEGAMWSFGAVVIGVVFGTTLLKAAVSLIPIFGSGVNATITFTLHEATGWALFMIFEAGKDPTKMSGEELSEYIERGKERAAKEKAEYIKMMENLPPNIQAEVERLQKQMGDKNLDEKAKEKIMKQIEALVQIYQESVA